MTFCVRLGIALGLYAIAAQISINAATFFTSVTGADTNPGTAELPFQTLKKGVEIARPGDVLIVREGLYSERITTVRGGSNELSRITIKAEGAVRMKGWIVNHPYITLEGFQISGHSGNSTVDAHVIAGRDGDHLRLFGCTFGPGVHFVRPDVRFESGTTNITSSTGGFLSAGLAVGDTLFVGSATNVPRVISPNEGRHRVIALTETSITVSNRLADQGPLPAYISANYIYGLYLSNGSDGAVVAGCRFVNLGFDALFILGSNHVIQDNVIETSAGWDVMHFGGPNHLFRRNIIRDSPLFVYQVSPDAMENYSPTPYSNVTFKENLVKDFVGVLAAQKGGGTSRDLLILRNVFIDVQGPFFLSHQGTEIRNNTFLRVARTNNPVVSVQPHPIVVQISTNLAPGNPQATHTSVRNNVFMDCGQASGRLQQQSVGWYEVKGPADTFTAEKNFATGFSPVYTAKLGWPESPELGGGDPELVDISDPLGPDGIPFTPDDGLRPRSTSKLVGAGVGGATIGAYEVLPIPPPTLRVAAAPGGSIVVSWPASAADWTLETSPSLTGRWYGVPGFPSRAGDEVSVMINHSGRNAYFRLVE
jgi:hypothetical protein